MYKKLVIILVFLLMVSLSIMKTTVAQSTTVYINPQLTTVEEIGQAFEVNVSISQVTDLAAWEFKLYYESSVLNATSITEGPFLKSIGNTTGLIPFSFTDSYNTTHGRIWFACTLTGQDLGASGNGTLATITFKAKGPGIANLVLAGTDLLDSKMPPNRISHTTQSGKVQVTFRNIAIIDVKAWKTVIGLGCTLPINVTALNLGFPTGTFNVTVYVNETATQTQGVILPDQTQVTIPFAWNTTNFAKGKYTLSAYAWPVPGENNTADNRFVDGWIIVSILGDVDGSFRVDGVDLAFLAGAWFSKRGDPNWNPNADIDDSGRVDGGDLAILGSNWFKGDP